MADNDCAKCNGLGWRPKKGGKGTEAGSVKIKCDQCDGTGKSD